MLSIPQIRYNWNFGGAQASTFVMVSMLPNSHFDISYPSLSTHTFLCTCSRDIGLLDIPLHHGKLESALRILQREFLLPGAFPVSPLLLCMAHTLSSPRSLLKCHFLRAAFWGHPICDGNIPLSAPASFHFYPSNFSLWHTLMCLISFQYNIIHLGRDFAFWVILPQT